MMLTLLIVAALCGGLTVDRVEGNHAVVECYGTGHLWDVPAHPYLTEGRTILRDASDLTDRHRSLPRAPAGDLDL